MFLSCNVFVIVHVRVVFFYCVFTENKRFNLYVIGIFYLILNSLLPVVCSFLSDIFLPLHSSAKFGNSEITSLQFTQLKSHKLRYILVFGRFIFSNNVPNLFQHIFLKQCYMSKASLQFSIVKILKIYSCSEILNKTVDFQSVLITTIHTMIYGRYFT